MRVLITGGSGFLGRGILRRVEQWRTADPPKLPDLLAVYGCALVTWDVAIYSRDETKQDECRQRYPWAEYILGDIKDEERLTNAMRGADWVIHAAALKYIPDAELNAAEAISVNVDGSRNVVRAAKRAGVRKVVAISTDKAVQPVNVYGASKMMMERLFADERRWHTDDPWFTCVRYGNVVGSTGSVIPLFQRQARERGHVTLTDGHMTRFWMSVDEAIDLILEAFIPPTQAGSILVPRPAAMMLTNVAKAAVDGAPIEYIGQRPGEKKHELLIHYEESVRAVRGPRPYYELLPVHAEAGTEAFTVSSQHPNRWMEVDEMRALIADAATV